MARLRSSQADGPRYGQSKATQGQGMGLRSWIHAALVGIRLVLLAGLGTLCACGGEVPGAGIERKGVVSSGPQITETVCALGEGDRLIGITDFCDYPPEVMDLPRIGGFMNPDFEKITLLRPELLIVSGKHLQLTEFAQRSGIPYVNVYMDSLDTIEEGIMTIGGALGVEEKARALRDRVRRELDEVRASVEGKPRPLVLIITGRQSHDLNTLATVGGGSFVSELVELAGGDNIYEDAAQPYLEASKETAVIKAPEAIVEFHAGEELSEEEQARYVADWNQLPSIPAVKQGRILILTESHALRPGPRLPEIARRIAAFLHPPAEAPAP
jgi:iron complex transport system substrate-binding protein